jgi:amidase
MSVARSLSAFVPHDLTAPLIGAGAGSLAGLSAAVKDMYDFAGHRTGGGSPDWLDAQAPARSTAAVVVRILDAGATIIGKTVCDEFFYSVSGANTHYGLARQIGCRVVRQAARHRRPLRELATSP